MRISIKEARDRGLIPPAAKKAKTGKVYLTKAQWDAQKIPGGIMIIIPENMPSLNIWKGWHWGKQDRFKEQMTNNLRSLALTVGRPRFERASVQITHYFRVNRRRDSGDNYAPKFVLDALKNAGVLVDDNAEVLRVPEPVFKVDAEAWRTEIVITQLGGI